MAKYPRRWLVVLAIAWPAQLAPAQIMAEKAHPAGAADDVRLSTAFPRFECGFQGSDYWEREIRRAVADGLIADPSTRLLPQLPPRRPANAARGTCLSPAQIFPFEDTEGVLLTNFENAQMLDLLVEAANALLAAHGDNYEFIGFWVNFTPHHTFGTAFYFLISNDIMGIGDVGAPVGEEPIFDRHKFFGLAGERIQGMVIMWNINSNFWSPGSGGDADFTRLVLGQEFEHRWALFLPDLADGRALQGPNGSCGRRYHWNFKVDGQGSGMEIAEWIGSNPATRLGGTLHFNTDTGGVFSYTDLYLMGYVTPEEMDAGNSELRYMDDSCASPYSGPISKFSSADIIETAGPRNPDSGEAQHDYKTAWIMIHQPGDPPSEAELTKALGIHTQHQLDWNFGTLGRGTMDNALFTDCDCNGIPDACTCLGDLDGDFVVGAADLAYLLGHWGPCVLCAADLDGDGAVGAPDLALLLGAWGACP